MICVKLSSLTKIDSPLTNCADVSLVMISPTSVAPAPSTVNASTSASVNPNSS